MLLSPILTLDPAKLDRDLGFLMGCLRDVLEEAGEHELSAALPWIGTSSESVSSGTHSIDPERLTQAYSIAFHLLSMVEQNAAVQQ
ncbi:MAG TPA: hypothetical protein VKB36_26205, partial [Vicinamibacterales bacterium]|nr:hypothetical protein [Vicinamibacterales bacterium]